MVSVRSVRIDSCTVDGRASQLGQKVFYPIHHRDDIGARLALNVHDHRRNFIHPCRLSDVFHVIDDGGDIRKMHRCAVVVRDDQRAVLVAG